MSTAHMPACASCTALHGDAAAGVRIFLACAFKHAIEGLLEKWHSPRFETDVDTIAKQAVAAMQASSSLIQQQQEVGECLQQPLPFTSKDFSSVDSMYLRTPIGTSHISIKTHLCKSEESLQQNRSVIAIAQVSGAGKTKAALSASMCDRPLQSNSVSSSSQSFLAVYALLSAGTDATSAVKCLSECIKAIESSCSTKFDDESLPVDDRYELFEECDLLYCRMVSLFYHCFVLRAAELCRTIQAACPELSRQQLAESLIRSQVRCQGYHESISDMVAHLFVTHVNKTATFDTWRLASTQFIENEAKQLGRFYVVFDEVTTLQRFCRGLFKHQLSLSSAYVQGGPEAHSDALLRRKSEKCAHTLLHHCTTLLHGLRRVQAEQLMETAVPQMMLDTHFSIWRDVLDKSSPARHLTTETQLPPLNVAQLSAFLRTYFRFHETVPEQLLTALLLPFVGRPLFFFQHFIPALMTELASTKPRSIPLDLLQRATATGKAGATTAQLRNVRNHLTQTAPVMSENPLSSPASLLRHCYFCARLNHGEFSTASDAIKQLVEMGVVNVDMSEQSVDQMTINLRDEPIMFESLCIALTDSEQAEEDSMLKWVGGSRLALEWSRNTATKGYVAEQLVAWVLLRHHGKPLLSMPGMVCTNFPPWLKQLQLTQTTAWSIPSTAQSELFTILDLSNSSPTSAGNTPMTVSPPPASKCIFFPGKLIGPDLILYFPPSSNRAFHVLLCIQCKAKQRTDATEALFSVNPGMFDSTNRMQHMNSRLLLSTKTSEWSNYPAHRQVRFVRMLFSITSFPKDMVQAVNTYNEKAGEHGQQFPILLWQSTPDAFSSEIHKAFEKLCSADSRKKAWSFPQKQAKIAIALQYAYPFQPEARKWQYHTGSGKEATLTTVSDDEAEQKSVASTISEQDDGKSERKSIKRKREPISKQASFKQPKADQSKCRQTCPMGCPGAASSSTMNKCNHSCGKHCTYVL